MASQTDRQMDTAPLFHCFPSWMVGSNNNNNNGVDVNGDSGDDDDDDDDDDNDDDDDEDDDDDDDDDAWLTLTRDIKFIVVLFCAFSAAFDTVGWMSRRASSL